MSFWQGKVVLVTGGSSGLGKVIAESFAQAGARVIIAALEQEGIDATVAQMRSKGWDSFGIQVNVTLQEDVDRLFSLIKEKYGALDVLVNNAGRSMRGKVLQTTPEQFRDLLELNFIALVRCTRAAVPLLLPNKGRIINIGSLASKSAARWVGAYPVSKFAVAAYSQQIRLEIPNEDLNVLLVCPGPIERQEARLYPLEGLEDLPEAARRPGGGVKTSTISPHALAQRMMMASEKRKIELIIPAKARLLFALQQLFPRLGDWIVRRKTSA